MAALATKVSRLRPAKRNLRTANGAYLLELLVAMFVSGMMAAALMTSITQGMSASRKSQNQVIATWLAKEAFERIRMSAAQNQSDPQHKWFNTFGALDVPNNTEVQFKVNSSDIVSVSPYDFAQRPLLLDLDNLKWINKAGEEQTPTSFEGSVKAAFTDTINNGKNIEVTIAWKENVSNGQKKYTLKGAVFPNATYLKW